MFWFRHSGGLLRWLWEFVQLQDKCPGKTLYHSIIRFMIINLLLQQTLLLHSYYISIIFERKNETSRARLKARSLLMGLHAYLHNACVAYIHSYIHIHKYAQGIQIRTHKYSYILYLQTFVMKILSTL